MTKVERIRQYVVRHYIEPARQEQLAEISILARDIRSEVGLPIDQTTVMQALIAGTFLNQNGLELVERLGEGQGWQGVIYRLSRTDHSPDKGAPSRRRPDAGFVSSIQPGQEQADDWRERALELPMGEFRELISDYLKAKRFSNAEVEIVIRLKGQQE